MGGRKRRRKGGRERGREERREEEREGKREGEKGVGGRGGGSNASQVSGLRVSACMHTHDIDEEMKKGKGKVKER